MDMEHRQKALQNPTEKMPPGIAAGTAETYLANCSWV